MISDDDEVRDYDSFAAELTELSRRFRIAIEGDDEIYQRLMPRFDADMRYVVSHDRYGGIEVKTMVIVLDGQEGA